MMNEQQNSGNRPRPFQVADGRGEDIPTSAITRDGARLRSLMERSGENGTEGTGPEPETNGDGGTNGPTRLARPDREETVIPLPHLPEAADPVEDERETGENEAETVVKGAFAGGVPSVPTMISMPDPSEPVMPEMPAVDGATQLMPVEMLAQLKNESAPTGEQNPDPENNEGIEQADASSHVADISATNEEGAMEVVSNSAGKGRRLLATSVVVGAGLLIGGLLYVGGGDLLSSLFANRNEGLHRSPGPAAVTARPGNGPSPVHEEPARTVLPSASAATPTPADTPAATALSDVPGRVSADPHQAPAPSGTSRSDAGDSEPNKAAASGIRREGRNQTTGQANAGTSSREQPDREAPKEVANVKAKEKKPETPAAAETASTRTEGKYTVQVRATTDAAEAKKIAAKLRSSGASGVVVLETKKQGEHFYRVRFGAFGSQKEARSTATALGFSDVWVVTKR